MKDVSFKKGEIIFRQGAAATEMYTIKEGRVNIYFAYGTPNEKMLTILEEGKYFGEMAIVNNLPHSATAVAAEETLLLAIDKEEFLQFVVVQPEMALEIMQNTSERLRAVTVDYMNACKIISEMLENGDEKPKKQGITAKLKEYANLYAEALNTVNSADPRNGHTNITDGYAVSNYLRYF